ncbi:ligand-binding sensor domain-containing protein [Pedobacter cryophilus]|uniref:Histidine kinase domain-containing protein n=1 Tax=Pedobacter cryophilus TaxID=2571271 RepID=A0A4U1BXU9_9SPHI|nr:sensor histidine kinase [Pedobacter cryophilus]TKB97816.1 hypothetical protein FA046_10700 [Pedobacter cryophilus]
MKKCLVFFLLFHIVLLPNAISQSLQFKNLNVNDGLLSSTVYNVFQDSKGFIWFSTINGVSKYDGKTFENFTTDNGLSDNEVLKIKEDSKGRIWFLTYNGRLSYYLNGIFYNPNNNALLKKAICHSNFVSFYEDVNHTLWFSTNIGEIVSIKNNTVTFKYVDNFKYVLSNLFYFEDVNKNLWSCNDVRFHKIKNTEFSIFKQKYYPLDVRSIYYSKQTHTLYFMSKEGLIEMKNGTQRIIIKISATVLNKGISSILVENNKLWIGLLGNGVKLYDLKNKTFENFLPDKFVSSIIRDSYKNIWISTVDNGVYLLSKKANKFKHYTKLNSLTNESIYSIIKDSKNKIWLGLRNGQINIINKDKIEVLNIKADSLIFNPVKQLHYDYKNKKIWFLSSTNTGYLDEDLKANLLNNKKQKLQYALKSFDIDANKNLAIATSSGLYIHKYKKENPGFFVFDNDKLNRKIYDRTFCLAFDKNNNLWYDQLNGLHILTSNHKILSFSKKIIPLNDRIGHILCDSTGLVYASTSSNGICIFKDYKLVKVITTKDGLNSNNCLKSYVFKNQLWVITSKGVNKIENPLGKIRTTSYTVDNGLLTNEVNDILVDSDYVYVATNKGLTKINQKKELNNVHELPIYFKKFIINGKEYQISNNIIELSHKDNNIQISFTAIDFEEPDNIVYEYKIKESEEWIQTSNNILQFASLEPGDYDIQVRAKIIGGIYSKTINIPIKVNPPFYKNPLFILSLVLIIITLTIIAINKYTRLKRIKEHKKLLYESKVIALEQQALQAMMNPHFIFNVMNSIQYFINTENKSTANKLLTGFARLIRKNLDIVNKGQISLSEEIEYLNLYLQLESLRFGEKLNYKINIHPDIDDEEIFIPSMLLQPFVENAIWHGIMPNNGKGNLAININQDQQSLKIIIEDDGIGIDNSLKTKNDGYISRGMSITRERIKLMNLLSGKELHIQVNQQEEGGTRVKLTIPLA